MVWVSLKPYAASMDSQLGAKLRHCCARVSVKAMPKLVTVFSRSELKSKMRAEGTAITATFMGAMLYHQVTRWRSMACKTVSGSKRCNNTVVAPDSIGMFTPISMPAMWYSGAMASSTSSVAMPLVLTDTSVLYKALRKLSMAPLGKPVVPEV